MGATNNRLLLADYLNGQQSSSFGRNYVLNPSGFENVNNISVSNSATVSRNTTSPLTAVSDIQIALTSDTNDSVTWTLNTLDNSLNGQNCMLSFDYTASSMGSAVQAQVLQGSNISATVTLNPASTSKNVILNTPCGNLGSATTVVIANTSGNSGSSTLNMANVNYGKATNIGTVAQAQLYGQVKITGCSGGGWSTTNTSLSQMPASSSCSYAISGNAVADTTFGTTQLPAIKFSSLPPGNYTLRYEGQLNNSSAQGSYFQFTDGTNSAQEISAAGQSAFSASPGMTQTISYSTPQTNVTLQIYGSTQSGGSAAISGGSTPPGVISVYYFPTQAQTVATASTAPATFSGYTNSVASGCSTASSSFADPSTCTGAALTQIAGTNISCTQVSGGAAIQCNLPTAGDYQVSANVTVQNSVSGFTSTRLIAGSSTVVDPGKSQSVVGSPFELFSLGGLYTAPSAGLVTFKVQGATNTGTLTIAPSGDSTGAGQIQWTVTQQTTNKPTPYYQGNVSSTGPGMYHVEDVSFGGAGSIGSPTGCSSSPCTIYSQSGSWVSSVTRSAQGIYVINFTSGEFSQPPACTVSISTADERTTKVASVSTSSVTVSSYYIPGSSYEDDGFNVICMGPH